MNSPMSATGTEQLAQLQELSGRNRGFVRGRWFSLRAALAGAKYTLRTQPNAWIELAACAVIGGAGWWFQIAPIEWALLAFVALNFYYFLMPVYGAHASLSASEIGIMVSALGIAMVTARGLAPLVTRRLRPWRFMILSIIGTGLGLMLLPLFFVYSGLNTQIGLVNTPALWAVTLGLIIVAVVGKGVACAVAARLSKVPLRESVALGALMNARGLIELILLTIGLEAGIITPTLFTILVLVAVVTTLMTSPIFDWVYGRHRQLVESA